jgi:hypothetical protein
MDFFSSTTAIGPYRLTSYKVGNGLVFTMESVQDALNLTLDQYSEYFAPYLGYGLQIPVLDLRGLIQLLVSQGKPGSAEFQSQLNSWIVRESNKVN